MAFEDQFKYVYKENKNNVIRKWCRKRDIAKIRQAHKKLHWDKSIKNIDMMYLRILRTWRSIEKCIKQPSYWMWGDRRSKRFTKKSVLIT
jgi:hypothetical protein